MILNESNYHSIEANKHYMSASQYGTFCACESRAMAEINGEWTREVTDSMLVGSYVDAYFSGTLSLFKAQTPDIFTQKGELKAQYKHAETIISRIERDPKMMQYLSGEWQVIRTAEICGTPWKIKMDVLHDGKCIVDLKVMKDFDLMWNDTFTAKVPWVEAWNYHRAAAIYQTIEKHSLPFVIAAATKEKHPDIALLNVPQEIMDAQMREVYRNAPRFAAIKAGRLAPDRCEKCAYCKSTKVLDSIINYNEVM